MVEESSLAPARPGLEIISRRTSRPAVAGAVPEEHARLRWADFVWRSLLIDAVAALALGWVVIASLFIDGEPGTEARDEAQARLYGRALRWALSTLGATFIKLGQVLSTRPDLLPRPMIEELRMLQDRLPPFPFREVRGVIESELGCELEHAFAELDEAPVAAASVAQVHRGRLHDGTEVAVKVLRPSVRVAAQRDGAILMFWARLFELHPRAAHAELRSHLAHFIEGILQQTELSREVAHYAKFRANFEGYDGVEFPRVFEAQSAERVMTMEFVRGKKVDELELGEFPELAARMRGMFMKMLFEDGFLHADLHPGNLVIKEDGTVAVFDVGLCKELTEELLLYYIDFNKCLVMGDVKDTMLHLRTFHSYVEGTVDWEELEADMSVFADRYRQKKASELEVSDMINDVFAIGRKHGVRPIPDMTLIMVGVVTAEGIGKMLDPESNSMQELARFLVPVLAQRNMLTPELMSAAAARMSTG